MEDHVHERPLRLEGQFPVGVADVKRALVLDLMVNRPHVANLSDPLGFLALDHDELELVDGLLSGDPHPAKLPVQGETMQLQGLLEGNIQLQRVADEAAIPIAPQEPLALHVLGGVLTLHGQEGIVGPEETVPIRILHGHVLMLQKSLALPKGTGGRVKVNVLDVAVGKLLGDEDLYFLQVCLEVVVIAACTGQGRWEVLEVRIQPSKLEHEHHSELFILIVDLPQVVWI
mmetsp:Transcript_7940/g.18401  ORF Transcript_7940/g.18401 Transcript_7940/m.18401 type:complete len:230 (+) Transcript_7940:705-1394(+)